MADELKVKVGVELDTDRDKIQGELDRKSKGVVVHAGVELEDKAISNVTDRVEGISPRPVPVRVETDETSLEAARQRVQTVFDSVRTVNAQVVARVNLTSNLNDIQSQVDSASRGAVLNIGANVDPISVTNIVDTIQTAITARPMVVRFTTDNPSLAAVRRMVETIIGAPVGVPVAPGGILPSAGGGGTGGGGTTPPTGGPTRPTGNRGRIENIQDLHYNVHDDDATVEDQLRALGLREAEIQDLMNRMLANGFVPTGVSARFAQEVQDVADDAVAALGAATEEVQYSQEQFLQSLVFEGRTENGFDVRKTMRKTGVGWQESTVISKRGDQEVTQNERELTRFRNTLAQLQNEITTLSSQAFNQTNPLDGERETFLGGIIDTLYDDIEVAESATADFDRIIRVIRERINGARNMRRELAAEQAATNTLAVRSVADRAAEQTTAINGRYQAQTDSLAGRLRDIGGDEQAGALEGAYNELRRVHQALLDMGTAATADDWDNFTATLNRFTDATRVARIELGDLKHEAQIQQSAGSIESGFDLDETRAQNLIDSLNLRGMTEQSDEVKVALEGLRDAANAVDMTPNTESIQDYKAALDALEDAIKRNQAVMQTYDDALKAMQNHATLVAKGRNAVTQAGAFGGRVDVAELQASITALETAQANLNAEQNPANLDAYNRALVTYRTILNEVIAEIARETKAEKDNKKAKDEQAKAQHKSAMGLQEIAKIRRTWTKAMQDANNVAKLNQIEKDFKGEKESIDRATKALQEFKKQMQAAGLAGLSAGDQIKKSFDFLNTFFSGATIFNWFKQFVSSSIQTTSQVDSSMVLLRKVTNETSEAYDEFFSDASEKARDLSVSFKSLIDTTTTYAKLGNSLSESSTLAQATEMFANVGDIDSSAKAAEYLISTMNGFGIAAGNVMEVVDKLDAVNNKFAIDATGLGEALTRSASSLKAANLDLDQSIALITAANTVVQNPETVGTALKTMSARIRASKTELEALGEEQDEYATSASKLRESIKSLTGVDIMEDDNTYKSIYTTLQEISGVIDSLSDTSRANVYEILFGKRQANIGTAILSNFKIAEDSLTASQNAAGTASAEYGKYLKSVEARQKKMQASFESFASTFMDKELVGWAYDQAADILAVLEQIVDVLGSIPSLIATVSAGLSGIYNVGKIMPYPG